MEHVIVFVVAVFFFLMGLVALVNPAKVTSFFSMPTISGDMRNEVRAVYGGFGIAMGVLLVAATRVSSIRSGVLLTVSIALLGMAAGRVASLFIDRSVGPYPYLFLAFELLFGILILFVWSR